jgi:tellurite methyltransferase
MSIEKLLNDIGGIDIYLLDQIIKGRYPKNAVILDAGCGTGRNLKWFYKHAYTLYGVDTNTNSIKTAKEKYPAISDHLSVQNLDVLDFKDQMFDHVICSAVLHFAQHTQHFMNLFSELVRVLKPGGSLFIRMTSKESIEAFVKPIADGVYVLPDATNRFLLTDTLLEKLMATYPIQLLEPKKYVNVANQRCMATIIFTKQL